MAPGAAAADAPVAGPRGEWLLSYMEEGFTLLVFGATALPDAIDALARDATTCKVLQVGGAPVAGAVCIEDSEGMVAARYDGRPGTCYLFRPDQHLCARWRNFDLRSVRESIARATRPGLQGGERSSMTTHSFGGGRPGSLPGSLTGSLNTQPNISKHDDFYHDLIEMHRDLSAQQSALGQCQADSASREPYR